MLMVSIFFSIIATTFFRYGKNSISR